MRKKIISLQRNPSLRWRKSIFTVQTLDPPRSRLGLCWNDVRGQQIFVAGFTLLELLVSIGLGLLLLLISAPAYHHLIARNKTVDTINHLVNAIYAARSEAVAEGRVIVFCGSGDGVHCDGHWQAGQLMLVDQTQQVLRLYSGLSAGDRLWWQSSLGNDNALKLAPTGFTNGQRGSFYYCPRDHASQYGAKIIVADSGRVRIETGSQELTTACTA